MGEVDVSATVVKPELKAISEAPGLICTVDYLRQDFTDHARRRCCDEVDSAIQPLATRPAGIE